MPAGRAKAREIMAKSLKKNCDWDEEDYSGIRTMKFRDTTRRTNTENKTLNLFNDSLAL